MDINEETIIKGRITLDKLHHQKSKIENVNNKLNNIETKLSYSEYLVNKMSSIFYNIYTNIFPSSFNDQSNHEKKTPNIKVINGDYLENIKEINLQIGDELDLQNELLNNINNKADYNLSKVDQINKKITYLER